MSRAEHRRAVVARTRLQLARARGSLIVLAVGLALAAASAVVLVGLLSGGSPLAERQTVRVAVDDAKSVVPGKNEVRWAGVVVGRITGAELEGGKPVLTAEIETGKGRRLHRDARLRLRPQTALNDMYLDVVDGGTPRAGRLDGDQVLDAGRTQTTVDVAEVLNVFSADVRDRLEQALEELAIGLPDRGAQLRSAFAELVPFVRAAHRIGRVVERRDRVTRRLVSRTKVILDELARRDGDVRALVQHADGAFGALAARRQDLDRTLGDLPPTLRRLETSFALLHDTLDEVRPALRALRPAARALPGGLDGLDRLVAELRPALTAFAPAIPALRPLARDLAPASRSLETAFVRLAPQVPRVDRVTAQVSRCKREVQKFFAWSMSVFKFGSRGFDATSPRGALIFGADALTDGNDPNLVPVIGCADGRPPR
ncbi:MAG TPA: MlaD family protein [Baekduia sp.]|nr:MlaD family protein [Baekduia sp.]